MLSSALKNPKWPRYVNPWKEEERRSVVNVAIKQQKKVCQASLISQNEATSSKVNNSPPTGARNTEAIAAPAPAVMKFLLKQINKPKDNFFYHFQTGILRQHCITFASNERDVLYSHSQFIPLQTIQSTGENHLCQTRQLH